MFIIYVYNVNFIFVIILLLKNVLSVSLWWLTTRQGDWSAQGHVSQSVGPRDSLWHPEFSIKRVLRLLNPPLFVGNIHVFCWLDMGSGWFTWFLGAYFHMENFRRREKNGRSSNASCKSRGSFSRAPCWITISLLENPLNHLNRLNPA